MKPTTSLVLQTFSRLAPVVLIILNLSLVPESTAQLEGVDVEEKSERVVDEPVVEVGMPEASEEDGKLLKALVGELSKHAGNHDLATLDPMMTERGRMSFYIEALYQFEGFVEEDPDPADRESFDRVSVIYQKHGLDKLSTLPGDEGLAIEDLEAFDARLLESLGDDRVATFTELFKASEGLDFELNPFVGKPGAVISNGRLASIELKLGEDGNEAMLPNILKFRKEGGKWNWDGFDHDAMDAAYEKSEGRLLEGVTLRGKGIDGGQVDLEEYRGKWVLIDFWGTWCAPCVAELPGLKKIHAALREKGFEVIGVAVDEEKALMKFLEKRPLPWENVVDGKGVLAGQFGVQAFPTTFLIDPQGDHVARNLSGVELLEELIDRMELDDADYLELTEDLGKH